MGTKRNHPPTCHSERMKRSREIYPSSKLYLVLVPSPTWWIPPLRLRDRRNDITGVRFYGFAYCFYSILRCPATLIRLALGRASFPRGKLLSRAFGRHHSTVRVIYVTFYGDESSPLHCVVPFIYTVYIRKAPYGFTLYRIPFFLNGRRFS